jgi:hypothetical protein|eukprot:COSAG02_NODE_3100_length_7376_cov_112.354267_1_plen_84_part_00
MYGRYPTVVYYKYEFPIADSPSLPSKTPEAAGGAGELQGVARDARERATWGADSDEAAREAFGGLGGGRAGVLRAVRREERRV